MIVVVIHCLVFISHLYLRMRSYARTMVILLGFSISAGLSFRRLVSVAALVVRPTHSRNLSLLSLASFASSHQDPSSSVVHSPASKSRRSMSSNNEVEKAKEAAASEADGAPSTIFDKIISGEISSDKIHEDDLCLAFRDVNPQAPVHFLVIPKNRDGLTQIRNAREDQKELLGHLMFVAQQLAQKECPGGFRIIVNDGKDGAQSVYHLHLHVMGGRQMGWPPGWSTHPNHFVDSFLGSLWRNNKNNP